MYVNWEIMLTFEAAILSSLGDHCLSDHIAQVKKARKRGKKYDNQLCSETFIIDRASCWDEVLTLEVILLSRGVGSYILYIAHLRSVNLPRLPQPPYQYHHHHQHHHHYLKSVNFSKCCPSEFFFSVAATQISLKIHVHQNFPKMWKALPLPCTHMEHML